jgi:hypothetical protein
MNVQIVEYAKVAEELIDLAADGKIDALVVADWHFPREMEPYAPSYEVPDDKIERFCHVVVRPELEQAVLGLIPEAERVRPTGSGLTRFYVRAGAVAVAERLGGFEGGRYVS